MSASMSSEIFSMKARETKTSIYCTVLIPK